MKEQIRTTEANTQKERFIEPTCELVAFNFENILANPYSPDNPEIVLPEEEF